VEPPEGDTVASRSTLNTHRYSLRLSHSFTISNRYLSFFLPSSSSQTDRHHQRSVHLDSSHRHSYFQHEYSTIHAALRALLIPALRAPPPLRFPSPSPHFWDTTTPNQPMSPKTMTRTASSSTPEAKTHLEAIPRTANGMRPPSQFLVAKCF
jgi:hypothetical protein